jgi:hypothetical protein
MESRIIARKAEISILKACLESDRSEFISVYGRRRVGKTYLVRELFEAQMTFYATGLLNEETAVQIDNFNQALRARIGGVDAQAQTWREAFANLAKLIEQPHKGDKTVVFLDEVPWMDAPDSGFLAALDHFWNHFASGRHDVLLIVCGSATSWMTSNLLNNYGGLHNRLTRQIYLEPFTLAECEQYYLARGLAYTKYQMVEAYMIFGGVPYYMALMEAGLSLYQNVDALYFADRAPLRNEYPNLFNSLFKKAEWHIALIEFLSSKSKGMTREDIIKEGGFPDSGKTSELLDDLQNNGFIRVYRSFGKKKRGRFYQVVDPFVLFHLRFDDKRGLYSEKYWLQFSATPAYGAWSGIAFERVCLLHLRQIKNSLGIGGVLTEVSAWRSNWYQPGAQIDLVIDRNDKIINLCEMKFSSEEYTLDKNDDDALRNKRAAFKAETGTRKALQTTLVTTYGLRRNAYANAITVQLTLDDLFV